MTRFWIIVGLVVIASIMSLWYGMSRYAKFDLTDASDVDLAERYRFVCGGHGEAQIDQRRVPTELHSLIPLANKYGRSGRIALEDCAEKMSGSESRQIAAEINAKLPEIQGWIEKFPRTFIADEVEAFRALLELRGLLQPIRVDSDRAVS